MFALGRENWVIRTHQICHYYRFQSQETTAFMTDGLFSGWNWVSGKLVIIDKADLACVFDDFV